MTQHFIETPRIILRAWQDNDLEAFVSMNADRDVMRFFPAPYSSERSKGLFTAMAQEFADCGYGLYAAQEKASGLLMGFIGFHRARLALDFCPCVEIGWRLNKVFWNKGYATEGARACLEHGFRHLGLSTVYSFTSAVNLPSQRVMQKAAMRWAGTFAHPDVEEGHILSPHVLYVATSAGWNAV